MPTIPNFEFREAVTYGSAVLRGLVDASALGSYLKPWCTPGILDQNGLFEFNAGHQNNGGRGSRPSAAAVQAAAALKKTQPGGAPSVDDSPGPGLYELPQPTADHAKVTAADYAMIASAIGVSDVAAVQTVAQVESGGVYFLADGRPRVRYEPHHFSWLTHGRFDKAFPALSNPSYSKVVELGLSKGDAAGYLRLEQAMRLDSDAAVQACAWGGFQVQGDLWKDAKFSSPHALLLQVFQRTSAHLQLFISFIQTKKLASILQKRDWAVFATRYNGKGQAALYAQKLNTAYDLLTKSGPATKAK